MGVDLRYACPLTSEVKMKGNTLSCAVRVRSMKAFRLHFMRW